MRKRRNRKTHPGSTGPASAPARAIRTALLLFGVALAVRLLFWLATPDADWPYTACFKGDAPVWMEYASALRSGERFELGLPIHPPGAAYLLGWLWNGMPSGVAFLRFTWALLGTLTIVFVYVAALRSFGAPVACIAGFVSATSTGLILLSTSLNNETPYLLLVAASLCLFEELRRPGARSLAAWSALQGIACLFRVEHVLFYVLALLLHAWLWRRSAGAGASLKRSGASIAFFLMPLLPWHLTAWRGIERFNTEPPPFSPSEEVAIGGVEERLKSIVWDAQAIERRERLPAFLRRTTGAFLAATVAHRGRPKVEGADFGILVEAFGYVPQPLHRFPFVSSYGPINFALANHPRATGGFSSAPLEEPPPLKPSAATYPAEFIQGLPPPQLSFVYPPHLRLFNDGYSLGWAWISERPGRWVALAMRKVSIFWSGAALGLTGYNLPLGLAGIRRAVDVVVPEPGWLERSWCLALLAVCVLGARAAGGQAALYPWLLFLLSKVAMALLFYGYARQGATVIPVVALLVALAANRWLLLGRTLPAGRQAATVMLVAVLALGIETARFLAKPAVLIDGREVGAKDPFADDLGQDHWIEVK